MAESGAIGPAGAAERRREAGVPLVRLRGVSKQYGSLTAVHPVDLSIDAGEFVAILGPSGCGKTTLLRMIGGFIAPTTGTIEIDGVDVTRLGPEKRPTNMVFQGYGLFPHMSVRQNVGYGLRIAGVPRTEVDRRVDEALALIRMERYADGRIDQLSGGQQQRVALARALVMKPRVLLLDEPLAALDLKLRQAMQEELRRIHRESGGTFVFVTHDQGEALALSSHIAVMQAGRIEQEGPAEDIYLRPRSLFVAGFIGETNILEGERRGGILRLAGGSAVIPAPGPDGPAAVAIRPERIRTGEAAAASEVRVEARVLETVFLGTVRRHLFELPGGTRMRVDLGDVTERPAMPAGAATILGWQQADQVVFEGQREAS